MKKVIFLLAVAIGGQGCILTNPNGFELYSTLGTRAVHEHKQSQVTKAQPCLGLKGWLMGCQQQAQQPQQQQATEEMGS